MGMHESSFGRRKHKRIVLALRKVELREKLDICSKMQRTELKVRKKTFGKKKIEKANEKNQKERKEMSTRRYPQLH